MGHPFVRRMLAAAALFAAACHAPTFSHDVYTDMRTAYRVGELPTEWVRTRSEGGDFAYAHADGGTIYADHACQGDIRDLPLHVLTNQMLFDVKITSESREPITLAGRKALRTRISGELDGVPIELDLVVLKKDGCTYDMVLIAGPATFADREQDFERFLRGFARLAGQQTCGPPHIAGQRPRASPQAERAAGEARGVVRLG
jgi:hypothetical protein